MVVRPLKANNGSGSAFFSGSLSSACFRFVSAIKADFRFVVKSFVPPIVSHRFNISWRSIAAIGSGFQIRPAVLDQLLPFQVLKVRCYWLLVQGFHRLLGGLQFTLAIVKLGSTLYMANKQRGNSWLLASPTSLVQSPNFAIKGTAACVLHSIHQHPAVMRRSLILVVRQTKLVAVNHKIFFGASNA